MRRPGWSRRRGHPNLARTASDEAVCGRCCRWGLTRGCCRRGASWGSGRLARRGGVVGFVGRGWSLRCCLAARVWCARGRNGRPIDCSRGSRTSGSGPGRYGRVRRSGGTAVPGRSAGRSGCRSSSAGPTGRAPGRLLARPIADPAGVAGVVGRRARVSAGPRRAAARRADREGPRRQGRTVRGAAFFWLAVLLSGVGRKSGSSTCRTCPERARD